MEESKQLSAEEQARITAEEQQKLRDAEKDRTEEGAAARAAAAENAGSGDLSDARPPIPAGTGSFGTTPTFPNVPSEGYKHNPANMTNMLPPERQAPRAPEGKIGQGRVKPHEQPAEKQDDKA